MHRAFTSIVALRPPALLVVGVSPAAASIAAGRLGTPDQRHRRSDLPGARVRAGADGLAVIGHGRVLVCAYRSGSGEGGVELGPG